MLELERGAVDWPTVLAERCAGVKMRTKADVVFAGLA